MIGSRARPPKGILLQVTNKYAFEEKMHGSHG
jgi:hypothetical protein